MQRRLLAFELAATLLAPRPRSPKKSVEEIKAQLFEFSAFVESYLLEKEREFELTTMPYSAYLQTPEWQARRAEALERARHRCQVCNSGGLLDVHHRTYERRGEERPEDLTVLCRRCHYLFHRLAADDQAQPQG